jgi:hypothetical protein
MSNTEVGQLRTGNEPRDAIHVAVAPVIAKRMLSPGTPITFVDDDQITVDICPWPLSVGIVDPFLKKPVNPGDRFWMFVNPNTITSLRHDWTHPAFKGEPELGYNKATSEAWLRDFCNNNDCPGYETVIEGIKGHNPNIRIDADYFSLYDMDGHASIPPEFWDHVEVVLGHKVLHKPNTFSCSC